mgnify:CR=1 FL=1
MPGQSPSQTVGPFFHDCLIRGQENTLPTPQTQGRHIVVQGQVRDGDGSPVPDAMVEIWQADANGFFNHSEDPNQGQADANFRGFGRAPTGDDGRFTFHTVKPGIIPGEQTPYINVRVFARGMLIHAVTRLYFAGEAGNASDDVLNSVPAARRETLIARPEDSPGFPTYCFNIHLQGEQETVFFDF